MQRVAVVSCSTSKFRKDSESSIFELAIDPCLKILKDSSVSVNDIDAVLISSCSNDQYSASIISEMLGIKPKIAHRLDSLCNSGTNAIISAYSYIVSGLCDSVLVVGAEKTNSPGKTLEWDMTRGSFVSPIYWAAMFAQSHMRKYGTTEEQMAMVSVKNRKNAKKNPEALFRKPITLQEVMNSKRIAGPLKLLDCSALCEGSSAVLVMSSDKAKKTTDSPVWIKGVGQQANSASLSKLSSLTSVEAAKASAKQAYEMANIGPSKIDVAEVHDAFSILEIMAYEDLGFVDEGKGGSFVNQNDIAINPRGGILGCGHSIGATGVAQVAEIAIQLAGNAGKRQISGCKNGLIHNLAAAGTSASVIILGA